MHQTNCIAIIFFIRNLIQIKRIPFKLQILLPPFIFSFRVKLPWIFFSSASMVNPPMSASRCVRFTMPMPNTMRVTCWGSELTRLRRLPLTASGLLGVAGSCCSSSKMTLQSRSEGRRPPSIVGFGISDMEKKKRFSELNVFTLEL